MCVCGVGLWCSDSPSEPQDRRAVWCRSTPVGLRRFKKTRMPYFRKVGDDAKRSARGVRGGGSGLRGIGALKGKLHYRVCFIPGVGRGREREE